MRELPVDIVIPRRITVTSASFEVVIGRLKKPRKPTKALRALLAGKPIDDEEL